MRTTVTLELDQALLQKAEAWAERHQITLSEAIANLLRKLPDPAPSASLHPWTQSLVGVISAETLEAAQADYVDYLGQYS